jgi:molybdopterin converting factor small subunit
MTVKVSVSSVLRHLSQLTEEPDEFEVAAPNAPECLRTLVDRFPSMKQWTYDKHGEMLPLIQFFVNGEKLENDELATPLKDGDEVLVFFAKGCC